MKIFILLLAGRIRASKKLPKPGTKSFGAENIRYDAKTDGLLFLLLIIYVKTLMLKYNSVPLFKPFTIFYERCVCDIFSQLSKPGINFFNNDAPITT